VGRSPSRFLFFVGSRNRTAAGLGYCVPGQHVPFADAHVHSIFPSYSQLQLPPWQMPVQMLPLASLHEYVVGPPGPEEPEHVRPAGGVGMPAHWGGGGG
jgi:hypothetical protein